MLLVVGPNPFSTLTVNAPHGNIMNINDDKHETIHNRFHLGLIEIIHELVLEFVEWNLALMLLSFSYQLL